MHAVYITHPEVAVDPAVPVPLWGLSPRGRARAEAFAARGLLPPGTRLVASTETKAVETASVLARACGGTVERRADMVENDRSSTGFLPPAQFEARADLLFAHPGESGDGWETANAAQARIVRAVTEVMTAHDPARPIVLVGHGCVGTLLKCWIAGRPIARSEDQHLAAPGGGNAFAFAWPNRLIRDWTPIETLARTIMTS